MISRYLKRTMLLIVGMFLFGLSMRAIADDAGTEWLRKIDAAETVSFSTSLMTQTITTSTGSERTMTFKSFSADSGDVSLMVYTEPARVAGDKILLRDGGDHIWYYMQRRDVTKHFARHTQNQSMMGSDFSYEDLAQGDLEEDYEATVLEETTVDDEPVVKLELIPTESGPSYAKVILYASTRDHISRLIEYYDEDGHEKTLYLLDFKTVDGVKSAHTMRMDNLREGSSTSMTVLEISYASEPDAFLFTKAALSRTLTD
jgi:Outer membrane lipoprotein-sorting protein